MAASYELDEDRATEFQLAKAYLNASQWELALTKLTDLIHSKGLIISKYPSILWPLSHYYAAVCYDKMGERAQAKSIGRGMPFTLEPQSSLVSARGHSMTLYEQSIQDWAIKAILQIRPS